MSKHLKQTKDVCNVYNAALKDMDNHIFNAVYEACEECEANGFHDGWLACYIWIMDNLDSKEIRSEEFIDKNLIGKRIELENRYPMLYSKKENNDE